MSKKKKKLFDLIFHNLDVFGTLWKKFNPFNQHLNIWEAIYTQMEFHILPTLWTVDTLFLFFLRRDRGKLYSATLKNKILAFLKFPTSE